MSDKVRITYRGKTYYRIADLAHDYGLDASLVSARWHSGHRNPADLVEKGRLHTTSDPHTIVYKGQIFTSAKQFAKVNKLIYQKVLRLMKKGITDPEQLVELGSQAKVGIEEMAKDDELDESEKTKLVNSQDLLTIKQVSEATGLPSSRIRKTIQHIMHGKIKDSAIGLEIDDIVKPDLPSVRSIKNVKNGTYIADYGLKKVAIQHILRRINIIKEQHMVQLPKPLDTYYYNSEDGSLWRYNSSSEGVGTYKILPQKSKRTTFKRFELLFKDVNGKNHHSKWRVSEIEDMLAYPKIKAEQLLSKAEICELYNFPLGSFSGRKVADALPPIHARYSQQCSKKVGWTFEEVKEAALHSPEKFVPTQTKYSNSK